MKKQSKLLIEKPEYLDRNINELKYEFVKCTCYEFEKDKTKLMLEVPQENGTLYLFFEHDICFQSHFYDKSITTDI